ncbi:MULTISPECIES: hypothetical protein [unclassified Leuconostoc]|uniref:hypothetical protein n=1 Tax=unclassified Leuconostoc TaxID=2685106 RepID=UPI0019072B46|nr:MULTISPECIES: hypothetical protein [unclassified Leuconostoc]MBK0040911.1 hypothetical protein [Leuconostoc sp. S51]MBK0051460.1 hypothetical protein [Leuconostoc sp. S50]
MKIRIPIIATAVILSAGTINLASVHAEQTSPSQLAKSQQSFVNGSISYKNGQSANKLLVKLISENTGATIFAGTTDSNGKYSFDSSLINKNDNYVLKVLDNDQVLYNNEITISNHAISTVLTLSPAQPSYTTSFTPTVLGKNGNPVANAKIELFDITYGTYDKVAEKSTDNKGQTIFTEKDGIKSAHSYCISINGVSQGYTFRSDSPANFTKSFTITNKDDQLYTTSFTPTVLGKNGNPVANAKIELFDITYGTYDKVAEKSTDNKGQTIFTEKDGIKSAHSYCISINGVSQGYTFRSDSPTNFTKSFTVVNENSKSDKTSLSIDPDTASLQNKSKSNNSTLNSRNPAVTPKDTASQKVTGILPQTAAIKNMSKILIPTILTVLFLFGLVMNSKRYFHK